MSVFKRRYKNRRGEVDEYLAYTVQFTDQSGITRRLRAFRDKAASEELERNVTRLVSLRSAGGMPDVQLNRFIEDCRPDIRDRLASWSVIDSQRAAGGKPLAVHVADWQVALAAKGNTPFYVRESAAKIERLARACGWRHLSDITADAFDHWRVDARESGLSIQSLNHYLTAARTFCNWLIRNGRLSKNPLAHLEKIIVTDKDRRRVRMASEDGELERLLAATMAGEEHHGLSGPERALLYRLAIETGFRWSECRSLVKASFNLGGNPPAVTVASGRAKNRKERTNPISRELAADLRAHMALFLPTAGAFPGLRTARRMGAEMLRADLEAAGLPYRDECGQVRDFHSLRKTFGTRLSRAGVPLPVAQRLLDHSTPELTANFYTGVMPADKAEAVARLPAITGSAGDEWSGKATSILEGLEKTGTQGGERLIAGGDTRVNECIGFFELSPPLVGGRLGGTANAMPAAVFGLGEAGKTIEGV